MMSTTSVVQRHISQRDRPASARAEHIRQDQRRSPGYPCAQYRQALIDQSGAVSRRFTIRPDLHAWTSGACDQQACCSAVRTRSLALCNQSALAAVNMVCARCRTLLHEHAPSTGATLYSISRSTENIPRTCASLTHCLRVEHKPL